MTKLYEKKVFPQKVHCYTCKDQIFTIPVSQPEAKKFAVGLNESEDTTP